ncbi:MAG TPA: BamA/TamA family outer membrane protein [Longimicrobiaceae bacterium]|nr:BamA/TamA family outer membrane protein [Longimicrobiaceae bacterium]
MQTQTEPGLPAPLRRAARVLCACLAAALAACVSSAPASGPYPGFAEFAGKEVASVDFAGEVVVPGDTLRAVVSTRPSSCKLFVLPICPFGLGRETNLLDLQTLQQDVARIQLLHRDHGYYGTRVTPAVENAGEDQVAVRFAIVPGDLVTVDSLEVAGTEGIVPPASIERRIPLREGGPFRRNGFLAGADTILGRLLEGGYSYGQVLRNYDLDTIADVARVRYEAVPGPLVRVDTVVILGAERLGQQTVRRQLATREGAVLRPSELNRSQLNLYDFQMVNFASVEIAPDTLQLDPDSARATVIVRVVEAPQYLGEVAGGYGTLDCFRAQARRLDRNFLGGGRTLELTGSLSKIGVGEPLGAGFEQSLCSALENDTIGNVLNYRVAADFVQPRLFGTQTSTTVGLYSERLSELNTYLRTSTGARVAVVREVATSTLATVALNVSRGSTRAQPIFFCFTLEVCERERVETLQESRWSNFLTLSAIRDRTDSDVNPTRGYQARATVDWATAALASEDRYLRLFGDAAAYREVRRGWVLAGRLQGGSFLRGEIGSEIPPERLFYAGGPNSVRGFRSNRLGPRVYLEAVRPGREEGDSAELETFDFASGGTRMVVGSAELRIPSPVLRDNLRVAAFVDGGRVWASRGDTLVGTTGFRFTPGAGVRFLTPVGPLRVDVAYNAYNPPVGPLYSIADDGSLVVTDPDFDPMRDERGERFRRDSFWKRLQIYIAVGQAF